MVTNIPNAASRCVWWLGLTMPPSPVLVSQNEERQTTKRNTPKTREIERETHFCGRLYFYQRDMSLNVLKFELFWINKSVVGTCFDERMKTRREWQKKKKEKKYTKHKNLNHVILMCIYNIPRVCLQFYIDYLAHTLPSSVRVRGDVFLYHFIVVGIFILFFICFGWMCVFVC